MRLTELEPHWVGIHGWDDERGVQFYTVGDIYKRAAPGGLSFICPTHRNHRLAVFFENPADGLPPERSVKYRWHREGEAFESLTLTPSINAQVADPTCWHGFITNGDIS
jgi:hypothetical protein